MVPHTLRALRVSRYRIGPKADCRKLMPAMSGQKDRETQAATPAKAILVTFGRLLAAGPPRAMKFSWAESLARQARVRPPDWISRPR
jgi:hypothetical protein